MPTLETMRKALLDQDLESIQDGIYGESVAAVHFEEIDQPFIHVQQEKWSKPQKLIKAGGKRPDFYLLPLDENFVMVDVKYHSLGEELHFFLSTDEIEQYKNLIEYTVTTHRIQREKIQLKLFIIPKEHKGLSYYTLDFHEFISDRYLHTFNIASGEKEYVTRYAELKGKLLRIMTKSSPYE